MTANQGNTGGARRTAPTGVWSRGRGSGPSNPIRVRTKRLDEIDGDKIALAYWLLAKQIVSNKTEAALTEAEVRRVADRVPGGSSNRRGDESIPETGEAQRSPGARS